MVGLLLAPKFTPVSLASVLNWLMMVRFCEWWKQRFAEQNGELEGRRDVGMLIRTTERLLSSERKSVVEKASDKRNNGRGESSLSEVLEAYHGLVSLMTQFSEQPLDEVRGAVEYLLDAVIRAERAASTTEKHRRKSG